MQKLSTVFFALFSAAVCFPGCSDKSSTANDATVDGATDGHMAVDGDVDAETTTDADVTADGGSNNNNENPCAVNTWDPQDFAAVYDVGPQQDYEDPSEVPWEEIGPGTLVRIYPREEPYRDKWVINSSGTQDQPIVVTGVIQEGERPIISGENAKTRTELDFWNEVRGLIKIGGSSVPSGDGGTWVYIENLDLREARPQNQFTDSSGATQSYSNNAAALYVEAGENLYFRGNRISWSGNGIFAGNGASDVFVQCNHIHDNGVPESYYEHNSYTEVMRITFEFNYYASPCPTCLGNNLKDRSAGTVIRYNWIEGGNRALDLVDSGNTEFIDSAEYRSTLVYGNVLIQPEEPGNNQVIHYGGDSGDTTRYRKGTLHLYYNTVISTREGNTTWMRLSTNDETCDARNNVVYVTAGPGRLAMLNDAGVLSLRNNWLSEGWVEAHGGFSGTITEEETNYTGADPGFADFNSDNFSPGAGSALLGTAGEISPEAPPVDLMYVPHNGGEQRDETNDIGAFEGP